MNDKSGTQFVSRRKLATIFLGIFLGLLILSFVSYSEIPLYGLIPTFILYMITTRTNLFGKRVSKQDDGSFKPE